MMAKSVAEYTFMRLWVILMLTLLQACTTARILSIEEVQFDDGININEAKALVNDYIDRHREQFCKTVYIYNIESRKDQWHAYLACEIYYTSQYTWMNRQAVTHRPIGVTIRVNKVNGSISRIEK